MGHSHSKGRETLEAGTLLHSKHQYNNQLEQLAGLDLDNLEISQPFDFKKGIKMANFSTHILDHNIPFHQLGNR